MANPAAAVFALSMVAWVVDVRFAPAPVAPPSPVAAEVCANGLSSVAPPGADAEIVVCGASSVAGK